MPDETTAVARAFWRFVFSKTMLGVCIGFFLAQMMFGGVAITGLLLTTIGNCVD